MDEKEENKSTAENSGDGDKFETTALIERAREERERMEAANQKKEELLNREELIMAKRALGGTAEAGQETKPKEETAEEYADRVMRNEK